MNNNYTQHDWNHLHDVVFHVTGKTSTREELEKVYESFPERLKADAMEWGMSDTLWRDTAITFLEDNK